MQQPKGQITLQTLAMPADTNANGDIFGGWILSQMDLAAGVLAKQTAKGRVVTIAINSMTFLKPVKVGDIVCCYSELIKTGRSSMTIGVEVWVHPYAFDKMYQVTEGIFVFVAIDEQGKTRPIK